MIKGKGKRLKGGGGKKMCRELLVSASFKLQVYSPAAGGEISVVG